MTKCEGCRDGQGFDRPLAMAFQPIIDTASGDVFAYEALVRGENGEGAGTVLSAVTESNRYAFDQACRVTALNQAKAAGLLDTGANLSINFLPNAVYEPRACIRATLAAAAAAQFPLNRIIFEITEGEQVVDPDHLTGIVKAYKAMGFKTAIDDFGAGYSNLALLTRFQPDLLKLDMDLIRDLHADRIRRAVVRAIVAVCRDLDIAVIAEGIETADEHDCLQDLGVTLLQGYLYARPGFRTLPAVAWPATTAPALAAAG